MEHHGTSFVQILERLWQSSEGEGELPQLWDAFPLSLSYGGAQPVLPFSGVHPPHPTPSASHQRQEYQLSTRLQQPVHLMHLALQREEEVSCVC